MSGEPKSQPTPIVAGAAPHVQLVVLSGSQAGMNIPCRRVVTLIGSRSGCKLNLQHPRIAPVHLAVVNDGAKIMAVDLASRTGTKLNGLKMELETLNHDDRLEVGPWEFRVEINRSPSSGKDDAHPFDLDQTPEAIALEHLDSGRVLQPNREICVLGRRTACDIHVDDDRVSRVHAILLSYFGYPAVCDLLSGSGTFVNDERTAYHRLQDKDVLRIGDARFRVRLVGSKVGAPRSKPKNEVNGNGSIHLAPDEPADDLVNIRSVEGAQRWGVADRVERLVRKA